MTEKFEKFWEEYAAAFEQRETASTGTPLVTVDADGHDGPLVVIRENHHYHRHPRPKPDERIGVLLSEISSLRQAHAEMQGTVQALLRLVKTIDRKENLQMVKFADLQAATEANTAATGEILKVLVDQHTELGELAAMLQAAKDNGSDEEIQSVIDKLNENQATIRAAIAAVQTPPGEPVPEPAPEPTPTPAPVEPTEPVPGEPVPAEPAPAEPTPEEPAR